MKNIRFENDIISVLDLYRKLNVVEENNEKYLKGDIDIIDKNGTVWDTYKIEIKGSENYPFAFPKLFETGKAFPKISDWHVYEFGDKSCCVDVTPNEIILCKGGLNLSDYIKNFAFPYLANQSYRIKEGYYRYGEYSHGIFGRIEYYQNKLKAKNLFELIDMFDLIIKGFDPPRTAYCPFCLKKKFRHCHRNIFREFRYIKNFLISDRLLLLEMLRKKLLK
jgi:hypothetical protein